MRAKSKIPDFVVPKGEQKLLEISRTLAIGVVTLECSEKAPSADVLMVDDHQSGCR